MDKKELEKLALEKSNVVSRILRSKESELYNTVLSLEGVNFNEKLHKYVYGEPEGCKHCGKPTKFKKFKTGFNDYCSQECASKGTSSKRAISIKQAFQSKYGVNSPSQLQSSKDKIKERREEGSYDKVVENSRKTKKRKYGRENYVNVQKIKETKQRRYGDENYSNVEKAKNTILERYGDSFYEKLSLNAKKRNNTGEIGFGSNKFKNWLGKQGVSNSSQLSAVKLSKSKKRRERTYRVVQERLQDYVVPLFKKEEINKLGYYSDTFKFKCKLCGTKFEDYLASAHIPRCTNCFPKKQVESRGEQELATYLEQILGRKLVYRKNRTLLQGKELDIYIPSRNLAIEYNGIYWHSEIGGGRNREYHLDKSIKCEERGIHLIHIFEDEWILQKEIVKQRINHILGLETDRVYARQCKLREISSKESNLFLEQYHIQGADKSSIRIGAYYGESLVAIMTFSHLRIAVGGRGNKNQYEMVRFCTSNKSTIGIGGKLLKYFIRTHTPELIITYADRRWSSRNNFYEKIGFKLVSEGTPNYWYVKNNSLSRFHRFGFRKSILESKVEMFDSNLTEWENMQRNGYDRVWDCGSYKYELKL